MGFTVHTLWDVYGSRREQTLGDDEWIKESAKRGWVCLTRDELRTHRQTILDVRARIFRVGRGARTAEEQIEWIRRNANRIVLASRREGPFVYVIREKRIERVVPS